ncbi:acetyl-CoA hydrolase/transferase C-terminal domain-containing protein [Peterkaempfera bronchialis]|uniref:Acetyl-CoA hydrolase n=1 Tax=Peterkaempfera bronchialis TaxID=2126346 RepID=A0A345SR05_9ACTN|nr:acetyl-CoA hydrolase/transferase C-terminal domain-containing protein [Peterkaempfera bronchialis]AXI76160.1 acetyl-CoA hydrolase [Peterkaempfera bronchialis]
MTRLDKLVRPGCTVAFADGAGLPRGAAADELSRAAAEAGGVRLFLGWCPAPPEGLDLTAFAEVRTIMAGYALRRPVADGAVRYLPARLGTVPALLRDVIRPDVLVAPVVRVPGGWRFTMEASWLHAAVEAGAVVAGVPQHRPRTAHAGPLLDPARVVELDTGADGPATIDWGGGPSDVQSVVGERVAALVPDGGRIQFAPGGVGAAFVAALRRPVHVDTGIVTPDVLTLDRRGLLRGLPVAPYLAGGEELYDWADGRPLVHPLENTHHPGRLSSGPPLTAVNTALQIDLDGQVNVEAVGREPVAGVGGQPDYMAAAARATGGLSVIALPSRHRGRPTLVESLSTAVSTPSHDVDVVVTEHATVDLRGLDRAERRAALSKAWAGETAPAPGPGKDGTER